MSLFTRLARWSVPHLVHIACVLALIALALMVSGILFPDPLNIILSMSLGHVACVAAAGTYGLAVLLDATQSGASKQRPNHRSVEASGNE